MEIEKKFLVRELPDDLDSLEKKVIEQGYLCVEPVVRIRRSNDDYILTYKSRFGIEDKGAEDVRVNHEMEVPLGREGYLHLKAKTDNHTIEKVRYLVPLDDGHTAELDIFSGVLKGLCIVEVEFKDENDAAEFSPPSWFGKNVSDDVRYTNSFLSTCGNLDVFK